MVCMNFDSVCPAYLTIVPVVKENHAAYAQIRASYVNGENLVVLVQTPKLNTGQAKYFTLCHLKRR